MLSLSSTTTAGRIQRCTDGLRRRMKDSLAKWRARTAINDGDARGNQSSQSFLQRLFKRRDTLRFTIAIFRYARWLGRTLASRPNPAAANCHGSSEIKLSSFGRACRASFFSRLLRTLVSLGPQVRSTPPLRSSRKRCNPLPGRVNRPVRRPRRSRPEETEEKMRVISQAEISQLTRPEALALLRRIAAELPNFPAGSAELRNAHANLQNIRRALAAPSFRLG